METERPWLSVKEPVSTTSTSGGIFGPHGRTKEGPFAVATSVGRFSHQLTGLFDFDLAVVASPVAAERRSAVLWHATTPFGGLRDG